MARRGLIAAGIAAGLVSPAIAQQATPPPAAQAPVATKTFESGQLRYTVALPAGCRHEQGPGTIDAVCTPDFDAEKSAVANRATALVLGVAAEAVTAGGDTSPAGLQQTYTQAAFKEELPEAVCGVSDKTRVRIENLKETVEDARIVYTADVACPAVKFLQIGERRAAVRYIIAPDVRYRLMARALTEDFAKQRAATDAFFASFRVLPAEKAEK